MAITYAQRIGLFTREVRLFLVMAALIGLAWDGMRAVLLNLYLLRLGYGSQFIGLVGAAGGFSFAAACLPAGALGARISSRRLIMLGVGLTVLGMSLLPLGELLPAASQRIWIPLTVVVSNVGLAAFYVHSLPYIMGATGPGERDHAFAAQIAIQPLAAFVGSLVAGVLPGVLARVLDVSAQDPMVYRYPLWLAAALLAPGVLALLPARDAPPLRTRAPGAAGDRPPIVLIVVVALVVGLRFAGRGPVVTFFNVYLDDGLGVSTALIGALVAAAQLLSVPAALLAPLAVVHWGSGRTVAWGTLLMALSILPLALISSWPAAGMGYVGSAILLSLTTGPVRVFSQDVVAPRWWATMSGAIMLGSGLSQGIMALVGGFLIAAVGYRTLFLSAAFLTAAGALLFWSYFRVPRGELACQPAPEVPA